MPTPANHTILVDSNGRPIPQYFVPGVGFKPLKGAGDNGPEYIIKSSALPTGAATEGKQDALIAKDFATQTTLAAILSKIIAAPATAAKQDSLETVLKAIRDSAGIKKITDALPAGTNKIGKVDVDSSALPTGAATAAKQDSLLTQTDIKLSALRDAIRGVDDKTLSDLAASLFFITQKMLSEEDFIAKADIKMSALRDAITAAGANAKTLKDLHDKLTSLETEIKAIKDTAGIKKINDTVDVQLSGSIIEYNWFAGEERPEPAEPSRPAIGVEVDADTGDMVGLLWNGEDWGEV